VLDTTVHTASFTAQAGSAYKLDPSGGSFTVTIAAASPLPTEGSIIDLYIAGACSPTTTVTYASPGSPVTVRDWVALTDGSSSVINRTGVHVRLVFLINGSLKTWAVD